jgi:hypothetical protein
MILILINTPKYIFLILPLFLLVNCSDDITNPNDFEPLEVNIRMEVQILDSTYQLYARPFTKIYFTTYKLKSDDEIDNFDQSDTTSCQNGWGVKELNYIINNKEEKIIIGAACDNYNGENYREFVINFEEAERRIDSTGTANMIKTFAIYYK